MPHPLGLALGDVIGRGSVHSWWRSQQRSQIYHRETFISIFIGGSVGRIIDQVDRGCMGQALEYAPNRKAIMWQNPDTGAAFEVTPVGIHRSLLPRILRCS
jgi:surface antigen